MNSRRFLLISAAAALIGGGSYAAIAVRDAPPPRPPWVSEDGTVDRSKAPACVQVLKGNGSDEVQRDAQGRPVCAQDPFAPPQRAPE